MRTVGQKVTADHLRRNAYLYIRQSSLRQVLNNTESTKRQYALRERAVALGWPIEQITVIDSDQGQSGASTADREGFKKLVSEVGMGRAGIVIGLEVSRLARNCSDWHRLLEICALTRTLILDEDGMYDPCHFNDRLLLGLKGTMSEAELHVLKSRLVGGIFAKASRGELHCPVPVGFVYDNEGKVILDPDKQVQESIRLMFQTFRQTGSAMATVKYFRKNGLKFPRKLSKGPNKGDLLWTGLAHSRALQILRNPRYAGAFFFGRTKTRKLANGTVKREKLPRDQWFALIKDVHEGYITWEEHEENIQQLRDNSRAFGFDRKQSPPREGPALLQGIVMCGRCGRRMTVLYHTRKGERIPDYLCQGIGKDHGNGICQRIHGSVVDRAVSELLVESVSPLALEVALNVQDELRTRLEEADRLRRKQVERARYEADLACRRYMQVNPDNRLVADTLEAEWNDRLRALTKAQEEYERQREKDRNILSQDQRSSILALATDFPKLWNNPNTPVREKKRMVRLLLEDVTLIRDTAITIHVRFKGGRAKSLRVPVPLNSWQLRMTSKATISQIDQLLDKYNDAEIANIMNKCGKVTGTGKPFRAPHVRYIRISYGLKSRYERLRERRLLTLGELSKKLGLSRNVLRKWARKNLLVSYEYNDKHQKLFVLPGNELIDRLRAEKRPGRSKAFIELLSDRLQEVQYEVSPFSV